MANGSTTAPAAATASDAVAAAAEAAERVREARTRILRELRKVIVGQDEAIDLVLTALFTGGHCLITGVPGLAKTLLIKTLADVLHLSFKRIQFTPDLMPADITGTEIIDDSAGHRELTFVKGPIFAQIILADEINRTPPKTQSALLEAMQEHHVTAAGRTFPLDEPFLVLATQNPIELEGTYPLPEAQLSRFMFNVVMSYLPVSDEVAVVTRTTSDETPSVDRVLEGSDILAFQHLVRQVVVTEEVARYAVCLVDASRPGRADTPDYVERWVTWGAGLRASQALVLGGKARALMDGRYHVSVSDIRALARPVLRHRIVTNFYAESEGVDVEAIIARLLDTVPVPSSGM
ncbi:MAG: AAA domain-containing protein [Acidobacteria bacterium]|nr:AAA domain-containing protein [Acidobacteriota bacterium]